MQFLQAKNYLENLQKKELLGVTSFASLEFTCTFFSQKISSAVHHPNSTIINEMKIKKHIRPFIVLSVFDLIALAAIHLLRWINFKRNFPYG